MHHARIPTRILLALEGFYFAITGVWPLVHLPSFLAVTGPKYDLWLVQTVGALLLLIGTVMLLGAARRPSVEAIALAVGAAVLMAVIDIVFVGEHAIPPIYLLDAAAEIILLIAWTVLGVLHLRHLRHAQRRGRDRYAGHLAILHQA